MKTETRRRIIRYKRAVLTQSNATLQTLLEEALQNDLASKADLRKESISADSNTYRLINKFTDANNVLFGQLVRFEAGKAQSIITLDEKADFYEINSITTQEFSNEEERERAKKKRREFIESILYFGCFDNHLVILQSAALTARDLETHVGWLLGSLTRVIDRNTAVIFQDKPSQEVIERISENHVKKVLIGAPLTSQDHNLENVDSESGVVRSVKYVPAGRGADILQAVLGDNWRRDIRLEDSLDESNIKVNLQVTFDRKTTSVGQKVIDEIATSLRHLDEEDVSLELLGGGTIKGNEIKLNSPISVKVINGSIDENDLFHQMHAWLISQLDSGEIEAEDEA